MFKEFVLHDLHDWLQGGRKCALLTLVNVDGSSPRPAGSQMAVNDLGEAAGMLTGGCAEILLIELAKKSIEDGESCKIRIGQGSPYFDVKLPCGSGIDIFIDVGVSKNDIDWLIKQSEKRVPAHMIVDVGAKSSSVGVMDAAKSKSSSGAFIKEYHPPIRFIVLGRGPIVKSLTYFSLATEFQPIIFTPEEGLLDWAKKKSICAYPLFNPEKFCFDDLDEWTAAATLFHDHEWEPPILKRLLASDCFYVGALGSRRAHESRCHALLRDGVDPDDIARISAPIGLDIGAKSPPQIALSIVSEIIAQRSGRSRIVI